MPVYDSGEAGGLLYYVMPYIAGESLRELLDREGRLPPAHALRLAGEVADALDYAHRQGIIHRDIKPGNVLLEDGHAVVADFGVALAIGAAGSVHLTEVGSAVGTPMYMSPEQVGGDYDVDGRSDIYSLGCLLFEALAGVPPFDGPGRRAILVQRLVDPPPRLRAVDPELSAALEAVVAQAMATDPADRFATAAELSVMLHQAEHGPPTPLPSGGHGVVQASIAVLPFLNLSSDKENEYFSEGITEEIINALAQVRGLRVAARTSSAAFRGTNTDAREIGERLKVRTILEGSVRKAGDRVRITAQLISAADGYHIWSQTYERTLADVFALQDELARAIASTLTRSVVGSESSPLVEAPTSNLDAYALYLQGRHIWTAATLQSFSDATTCFERAVALDPDYAEAHAWLSYGYAMQGFDEFGILPATEMMPKAKAAALRALELNDALGDAHFARAVVAMLYDWDWALAQAEFSRAMSLPGLSALAQHWYALFLCTQGHPDQGLQVVLRAQVLDPLSVTVQASVGRALHYAHRFDEAIACFRKHLALNPDSMQGYVALSRSHSARGTWVEGLAEVEQGINILGSRPLLLAYAGQFHGKLGHTSEALALLGEIRRERKRRYVPVMFDALILGGLSDLDEMFRVLEAGYRERSGWMPFILQDAGWDPVRSDPRFQALLQRLRFDA
jgi:serine/threonine-protein kinase